LKEDIVMMIIIYLLRINKEETMVNYHITVINVAEYNKLSNDMGMDVFTNSLTRVFKYEIDDLKLME
jgi:hypothetical protein